VSERAAPFYCPYCGEEDLRPDGDEAGRYRCTTCLRVFVVSFKGLGRRPEPADGR